MRTKVSVQCHKIIWIKVTLMTSAFTLRNSALAGDLDGNFLEALDISHTVQEGHEDLQSRLQSPVESSHAFNNPCFLLWHKLDNLSPRSSMKILVLVKETITVFIHICVIGHGQQERRLRC
jgi:hypothetical protein